MEEDTMYFPYLLGLLIWMAGGRIDGKPYIPPPLYPPPYTHEVHP